MRGTRRGVVPTEPRAYLVPLHKEGESVLAHLFAYTRFATDLTVQSELRHLVEGHGMPWRTPDILVIDNPRGTVQFPATLFLAEALARQRWFDESAMEMFFSEVQAQAAVSGTAWTRWFVDRRDVTPSDGLWRQGRRAILVADLDSARLALAAAVVWMSLPQALRPVEGYEENIENGHAQSWDASAGAFRTPEETRKRWRAERRAARDAFLTPRRVIDRRRWRFLSEELENRARHRSAPGCPRTMIEEFREEVQRGVNLIDLRGGVREFLSGLGACARARPDEPMEAVTRALPKAYQTLVTELRKELADYLQQTVLPGRRRQYESTREHAQDLEALERKGAIGESTGPDILGEIEAKELAKGILRMLTPAERELFEALVVLGESPAEYAERTGRTVDTVYVQKASIRRKTDDLLNSA